MRSERKPLLFIVGIAALIILLLVGWNLYQKNHKDTQAQVYASLEDIARDPLVTHASEEDILFEGFVPCDGYAIGLFRNQKIDCLQFFAAESLSAGYRLHASTSMLRDLPIDQARRGMVSFEMEKVTYRFHHLIDENESATDEFSEMIALSDGRFMHYQIETVFR